MKQVCIITILRDGRVQYRFDLRPLSSPNIIYEVV